MAVRENYDSAGIHTGLEIGESFSNLEMQLIANRKAVFKKAMAADSFKTDVYRQFRAYNQANEESINKTLTGVLGLINAELKQSYDAGTNTVDRVMEAYKKQGYTPPKQPEGKSKMLGFQTLLTATMTALIGIAQTAKQSANNQLISIANLVDPEADDLAGEIDRVQAIYLLKGIAGSESVAGVEKNMSSQAEFITRAQSHQALLKAEGERSKEYGNPLVQISAHPSSCPLCTPWQGAILINDVDADGKPDGKHELLSTAIAAGLFHYNCYDDKTEVYTNEGWKLFDNLTRDELIYSLNPETKLTEWQKPINYIKQPHNGKMIHLYNNQTDLMVTPDHNILFSNQKVSRLRFKPASGYTKGTKMYAGQEWYGDNPPHIMLAGRPVRADLYCKLLAYYLADGSLHNQEAIKIAQQDNEDMYNELKALPFKVWRDGNKIVIYSRRLASEFSVYGRCDKKYIPENIKCLSRELISTFLMAYLKTDGYISKNKPFGNYKSNYHYSLFTTSKRMADDLGELALKAGYRPSFTLRQSKGTEIKFKNGKYTLNYDLWTVNLNTKTNIGNLNKEQIDYNGFVYCVELPKYHTLLIRRNGRVMWSGNCRHNFISYVEGLTRPDLFEHDKASPKETATRYAIEQEQRYNERMIREYKRREAGAMSESAKRQAEAKIAEWQARQRALRDIAKERGVPYYRQYSREQIGSETKPTLHEFMQNG